LASIHSGAIAAFGVKKSGPRAEARSRRVDATPRGNSSLLTGAYIQKIENEEVHGHETFIANRNPVHRIYEKIPNEPAVEKAGLDAQGPDRGQLRVRVGSLL
jgi:hypothetical protein